MPKIQSYVPATTYKKMEIIIEEMRTDGALRHEANMSSLVARLINLGLILYEAQKKSEGGTGEDEAVDGGRKFEVEDFVRENFKGTLKVELYSQILLQLMLYPDITVGSYEDIKQTIHNTAEEIVSKL
ncbi:TPA: hypothetical protein NNA44_004380 [Escherichia coli]|nr:hypothetical protein [Escherichia coli]HAV9253334.1 hypothetical protein [Escherichia coli]HAW0316559.1 hypothetical protein [Escherichia coli]HAW1122950.1 hypothetical protein [Escherichia coli]HCH7642704.1 hypothetical protein [Escherichia coli]